MDKNQKESTDLKILVIGKSFSGKTSFVNRWINNVFNDQYKSTIVSEYNNKIYKYQEKFYRIMVWDLAGQDRTAKITKTFAKGAHGVILMCAANDPDSREE